MADYIHGPDVFPTRQGAADSRSCFLRDGRMQRKRRRLGERGVEGERNGSSLLVEEAEGDAFIIRIAGLFWRPEAFRLLGEIHSPEKEIGGRLSVATYGDVKDREKEIQKGKELDEEDGIYGRRWRRGRSADGIRGMSCNNRAAIRASVLTTGGATTRLVASARNEGDENSRNFAIGG